MNVTPRRKPAPSVLEWLEKNAAQQTKPRVTCRLYTKAFDRLCVELGATTAQDSLLVSFDAGAIAQRRVFVVRDTNPTTTEI